MSLFEKFSKELTAQGRKHIAEDNFALPGRRYPIHDLSHARNALARVAQHGSAEEQAAVRSAVYKKYPALKERTMEKEAAPKVPKSIMDHIGEWAGKAKDVAKGGGKGFWEGASKSTGDTIGKHLKLEGLKHIGEGYEAMGKAKGLEGKAKAFAHGLGKAAPSLAAGGAYLYGAKKVYDKTLGSDDSKVTNNYYGS